MKENIRNVIKYSECREWGKSDKCNKCSKMQFQMWHDPDLRNLIFHRYRRRLHYYFSFDFIKKLLYNINVIKKG